MGSEVDSSLSLLFKEDTHQLMWGTGSSKTSQESRSEEGATARKGGASIQGMGREGAEPKVQNARVQASRHRTQQARNARTQNTRA